MARLISHHARITLHTPQSFDMPELLTRAIQAAVLGGIGVYLAIAIANTILGTGQPNEPYSGPVAGR